MHGSDSMSSAKREIDFFFDFGVNSKRYFDAAVDVLVNVIVVMLLLVLFILSFDSFSLFIYVFLYNNLGSLLLLSPSFSLFSFVSYSNIFMSSLIYFPSFFFNLTH